MEKKQIFKIIENQINSADVVLYMKGDRNQPLCGFSATVCHILEHLNLDYKEFNILEDHELRQGIKEYSDWPTIPQIYIKGEFIGGCDIAKEMFLSGELVELLKSKNINFTEPVKN